MSLPDYDDNLKNFERLLESTDRSDWHIEPCELFSVEDSQAGHPTTETLLQLQCVPLTRVVYERTAEEWTTADGTIRIEVGLRDKIRGKHFVSGGFADGTGFMVWPADAPLRLFASHNRTNVNGTDDLAKDIATAIEIRDQMLREGAVPLRVLDLHTAYLYDEFYDRFMRAPLDQTTVFHPDVVFRNALRGILIAFMGPIVVGILIAAFVRFELGMIIVFSSIVTAFLGIANRWVRREAFAQKAMETYHGSATDEKDDHDD